MVQDQLLFCLSQKKLVDFGPAVVPANIIFGLYFGGRRGQLRNIGLVLEQGGQLGRAGGHRGGEGILAGSPSVVFGGLLEHKFN